MWEEHGCLNKEDHGAASQRENSSLPDLLIPASLRDRLSLSVLVLGDLVFPIRLVQQLILIQGLLFTTFTARHAIRLPNTFNLKDKSSDSVVFFSRAEVYGG